MEITEVRIKLVDEGSERLQAFCSITLDNCFVIRDLKIIEGTSGPFVAMPSRKLTFHCPQCGSKNHLRACYCNQCGSRFAPDRAARDEEGRAKLYADIAHPINSACREMIQQRVIQAFHDEIERAKLPGYVSTYDDFDEELPATANPPASRPARETKRIEAPSRELRGPHRTPQAAPQTGNQPSTGGPHILPMEPKSAAPSFGAGVFEER